MNATAFLRAASLAAALAIPSTLVAHEDDDHGSNGESRIVAAETIKLPAIDGPKPWSDAPHLNDPSRFHIAIMTDRTGGHRPGIWMEGVKRVNLMRPEFVVSVGDLIEGYTENVEEIERQWSEFLGFIDQLDMKFFFVAGNHDLTNPVMHDIWRDHFGAEWYSFDYKGVHFVCLNSEDPQGHFSDEQLAWLEDDLAAHEDARWTLVFFHKPLWLAAEAAEREGRPDPSNWARAEAMFGDRSFTVFAGHVHHYAQYDRDGKHYYHLATTGGGTQLRGVPYGEFDHVTWLTMEPDGPHVSHLLLDGVLAPDAVTEESLGRFRRFLADVSLEVAPVLVRDADGLTEADLHVRLDNGFDQPIVVDGAFLGLPLRGLYLEPEDLELQAGPGETIEASYRVRFGEELPFDQLARVQLSANISTIEETPLRAEREAPVVIDRGHDCPEIAATIDGKLDEWPDAWFASPEQPTLLGDAAAWTGPADASFEFCLGRDDENLYFAAKVRDENLVAGDGVDFRIDGRPAPERRFDSRQRGGTYRVSASAPIGGGEPELRIYGQNYQELTAASRLAAPAAPGGYVVEIAVPLSLVSGPGGDDWTDFQLTCVQSDVDEPDGESTRVVWRGGSEVDARSSGYGHFVRD